MQTTARTFKAHVFPLHHNATAVRIRLRRIIVVCTPLPAFTGLLFCLAGLLVACTEPAAPTPLQAPLVDVPAGFPSQTFPIDNDPTRERVALGKALFFSTALSSDNSVACASCHRPELAFTDGRAVSLGAAGRLGTRNAPSLANVGYYPYYLREGSLPTLEMQVLVPIQEHDEFDMNILHVAERLRLDSSLVQLSMQAYARDIDPYVITRAIACYERTLVSGRSRYDTYTSSSGSVSNAAHSVFNESEKRGMALFFSDRARCHACHGGFAFTNHAFANNGLSGSYSDNGRFRFTKLEADRATFKTPSLRNVGVTAPYMHNGSVTSLTAVVAHYNSGGALHANKSPIIKPLNLSAQEQLDLVSFLHTLTDETFIANDAHRP